MEKKIGDHMTSSDRARFIMFTGWLCTLASSIEILNPEWALRLRNESSWLYKLVTGHTPRLR